MQDEYDLTLNYSIKETDVLLIGEITSIRDKSTGVKSRPKKPLCFRARRNDKHGFTTWIVSLHDGSARDNAMLRIGYTPHIDHMNEPFGRTPSLKETQDMYQAVLAAFTAFAQNGFRSLERRCSRTLRYNNPEILIKDKLSAAGIEYTSAANSSQVLQYEHIMSRPFLALGCPDVTSSILAYQKEGYSREAISLITGTDLEEVWRVLPREKRKL